MSFDLIDGEQVWIDAESSVITTVNTRDLFDCNEHLKMRVLKCLYKSLLEAGNRIILSNAGSELASSIPLLNAR